MQDQVARWVRIGTGVGLALPQLLTGVWALVAPESWWNHFPGIGPALVSATPPFNEHLVRDVGAGFLATGTALAVAAVTGRRAQVGLALMTYLVFTVPHVWHHATHDAPGLTGWEDTWGAALLGAGAALAAVLAYGAARGRRGQPVARVGNIAASKDPVSPSAARETSVVAEQPQQRGGS